MNIARDLAVNTTSTAADIDTGRPMVGIQPRYSGLRVEGTATTPSSTISIPSVRALEAQTREYMVEMSGFEPPTSSLRTRRSPN